jgi:serine/threonine-protein kinase SRPK3
LSQSTEEGIFNVLGTPESDDVVRLDGKPLDRGQPHQLVKAAVWDDWVDEDEEDLRIIDLGEAFLTGAEPEKLAQPSSLQAPETIFTKSFDHRLDLWRAGCVVGKLCLNFRRMLLMFFFADLLVPIQNAAILPSLARR